MGGRHTSTTRVLLADDHGLMRSVMAMALQAMPGFEVVGQATNGRDAVEAAERLHPDLVVMDVRMPLLDGMEATRRIRRDLPETRILVLTGVVGTDRVLEVLRAGANGLVPKTVELSEVERALRAVAAGGMYISPELAGPILANVAARPGSELPTDDLAPLSGREREVIQLIGEGQSTREIASGLFISPKTVAQHKANIVKKLGLRGTRELQILAAKREAQHQPLLAG